MLYLLKPDMAMAWVDLPGRIVIDLYWNGKGNLDRIKWEPTDRRGTAATVHLALRYGVPVPTGIAVDATDLSYEKRASEMKHLHAQSIFARQQLGASDRLMETLMPGWRESGAKLDDRVDESVRNSIFEAEQELAKMLEKPVQSALLRHWAAIGGFVPPADGESSAHQ